ncbi:methyl-accepting chemotaxis protein [Salinicola sp. CPA57]|uniref:methyl-accepting chemotaxis protein n=1 Tax=Salinicola sp. CPA57 TaxID=1949080 RepID=UPI0013006F4B|nr:methyl-accepting chemotaxis protein [Salinicola sp. CPA57]
MLDIRKSVKARLIIALGLMIALMVGIGVQGILSNRQTQQAMQSIVEDNVATMVTLSSVIAATSDNRTIFAKVGAGDLSAQQRQEVDQNRDRADEAWSEYYPVLATSDAEKTLSETYLQQLQTLRDVLDSGQATEQQINESYTGLYDSVTSLYRIARESTMADYQQSVADYTFSRNVIAFVIGIGLLFAIAIGWWLVRGILRPLREATAFSEALAKGDLGARLSASYRDEFGRMLNAMAGMRDKLSSVIGEVARNARNVESISAELAAGNENLSQRTQEQAASLQETAAALEQITNTVGQNADNAVQADQLASQVSTQAKQGGEVVNEAIIAMQQIDSSSKQISNIIGMIDEIAFQTNLLALNASVEAARAGEQGRGFAVVAHEVRQLASRSANAAGEIKQLVSESAQRVSRGSELVNRSGETLANIVSNVEKVTDLVSEIAVASREQSTGIQQINLAVGEMDSVTQQNASLVEESTGVTGNLQVQAELLAREVGFFSGYQEAPASVNHRPLPLASGASSTSARPARPAGKTAPMETEEWSSF